MVTFVEACNYCHYKLIWKGGSQHVCRDSLGKADFWEKAAILANNLTLEKQSRDSLITWHHLFLLLVNCNVCCSPSNNSCQLRIGSALVQCLILFILIKYRKLFNTGTCPYKGTTYFWTQSLMHSSTGSWKCPLMRASHWIFTKRKAPLFL